MKSLAPLALLVLLLPFEPMEPFTTIYGFEVSHLELSALVLLGISAVAALSQRGVDVPLSGPALALLLAYLLSTALAEGSSVLPLKFTLRMTAAVVAFAVTSLALSARPRVEVLFLSFAVAGGATAVLGLLEAGPWPFVDAVVEPFREHSFEVGGRHRVAATFSYPNTAAGFLVVALPPAASFLVRRESSRGARAAVFLAALGMFTAVLLTYSRGALLGAAAAIACLSLLVWKRGRKEARPLLWLSLSFLLVAVALLAVEPAFRWRAWSEGDRSWYEAAIEPEAESLDLEPGELVETVVRVENVGKIPWESAGDKPFHLSYRWFRPAGDDRVVPLRIEGERTGLGAPIAPGRGAEIVATVRAPREPGRYVLIWDMVHEHTTWFSDKVGLGAPVSVVVGLPEGGVLPTARDVRRSIAEASWRPGRRELWGIALGLFREHPVLGVGPDNFRWLYGPAAGRRSWDTRVSSNSLYLELLATVGLAGFAAFAALVAGALLGLLRRARRGASALDAAVLAASLVGFLVHGLFDYLLAFTPIYLALFVLLGAASAALRREALA